MSALHPEARRWTVLAFIAAALLVSALLIWQLSGLTPAYWCGVAKAASTQDAVARLSACLNVLVRLLDIKDHAVLGLLGLLGVLTIALSVVALDVKFKASSSASGLDVDIGADTTHVSTADSSVDIPTPPASGE